MTEAYNLPLIDSNILIYAYDRSEKTKNKIAAKLIKQCFERKTKYNLSVQNLSEFFVVVTKKIDMLLSKRDALEIINEIVEFDTWTILSIKPSSIILAIKISEEYNMSYWDSLLAATMKENGITTIYTENEKDFKIPWIKVINPFKK